MQDRFKFRYVFKKDFGGKIGTCYKMPIFKLNTVTDENFNEVIKGYTNYDYKLISIDLCSGLQDKYNKPIFEGDILKFPFGNTFKTGAVIYKSTIWDVSNAQIVQGAFCGSALINCHKGAEITGNIYENSELLKEVNNVQMQKL